MLQIKVSMPVQTGPRAQPASYIIDTRSFPGIKWLRHGPDHPYPSSVTAANGLEL